MPSKIILESGKLTFFSPPQIFPSITSAGELNKLSIFCSLLKNSLTIITNSFLVEHPVYTDALQVFSLNYQLIIILQKPLKRSILFLNK
jgi:hypothetical protein